MKLSRARSGAPRAALSCSGTLAFELVAPQCPLLDFPPRVWHRVKQVKSDGVTISPVVELTAPRVPAPRVPVLC